MKELGAAGKEVAMAKLGAESARVIQRALFLDMKAGGHKLDVERWKQNARDTLSPEHYLIWEERVLPLRILAWQEAELVSDAVESEAHKRVK